MLRTNLTVLSVIAVSVAADAVDDLKKALENPVKSNTLAQMHKMNLAQSSANADLLELETLEDGESHTTLCPATADFAQTSQRRNRGSCSDEYDPIVLSQTKCSGDDDDKEEVSTELAQLAEFDDVSENLHLAQIDSTESTDITHTCTYAPDRNKADLPKNFAQLVAGPKKYTDDTFPTDDALNWSDLGEPALPYYSNIVWRRASEAFPKSRYSLFGSEGASPEDIRQGYLGNCWFMSAASAVSEVAGRLESVFVNNELNDAGIYGVNFYTLGVPHTVIIDDYLPLANDTDTLYAHISEDSALWGPLLEKAFAKYMGNYQHIEAGDARLSARYLAGGPFEEILTSGLSADDMWAHLVEHDGKNDIIQFGIIYNPSQKNEYGLTYGHAYTILGVKELSTGDRLVKVRNPWGSESYTGDWSDSSDKWTDALKEEVGGLTVKRDGTFYMSLEIFMSQDKAVTINYDVTDWYSASFLMLDDETDNDGGWGFCGSSCKRHELTLKSDVDQTIYLNMHMWPQRCYGYDCQVSLSKTLKASGHQKDTQSEIDIAYFGQTHIYPFTMSAGEEKVMRLEVDLSSDNSPKDWSVVAYGDAGKLSITHNEGLKSASLPYIGSIDAAYSTELKEFVLAYNSGYTKPQCGAGITAKVAWDHTQMVAMHLSGDCGNATITYTIYMLTRDWRAVDDVFETDDYRSQVVECGHLDNAYIWCKYRLSKDQPWAGFRTQKYAQGLLYVSKAWD